MFPIISHRPASVLCAVVIFLASAGLAGCNGGDSGNASQPATTATTPSPATYAVGGTTNGLTGTGLVLQNNGGDDIAVAANGAFAFATPVASGAAYAVTVKTQPSAPPQTCTVNNGSATMGSAAVSSVTVLCSISSYPVGATVKGLDLNGLSGSGLVLQNNGADDMPVAADGTFNFKTPVASGANYAVTVKAQPHWNSCSVNNGGGTVTTSTVTASVLCLEGWTFAGSTAGGAAAAFFHPIDVAVDGTGNVYVADYGNHRIRKISPYGAVTTLAGSGVAGSTDGTGTAASFNLPSGVAVDGAGNVYVADTYNHLIRKITSAGVVSTLAGSGSSGSADGTGSAASFYYPSDIVVDLAGNVFVADTYNHLIRMVTPTGVVTTLAGTGTAGFADGPAQAAAFNRPAGIAVDAAGNIYVSDLGNARIRKISPANVVTTLAGSTTRGSADGTGAAASFTSLLRIATDAAGNVYAVDAGSNAVRKVTPAGVVTTLVQPSFYDWAYKVPALLAQPFGVAVDVRGNIFVADTNNALIRMFTVPAP
ncbi:NHL repeat-containing protein [Cupriavidus metallidurans]|uniref:NHL repeat-containing protein n=1 Tax=Cupriavidus metallidurans TaxID=119219 RepID=UPI000AEDC255|nr:NHL repeat-containing protein [Cupriavidus metallidurans]